MNGQWAETFAGTVESIVFVAADDSFCVFKMRLAQQYKSWTLVGNVSAPLVGEEVEVSGTWVEHPRFGRQLRITALRRVRPQSAAGIVRYLGSGLFRGIGPALAKRIVDHFGEETLAVLDTSPERLAEVRGIGETTWRNFAQTYHEVSDLHALTLALEEAGVAERFAAVLQKQYGESALTVLENDPYRLARDVEGFPFRSADALAMHAGMPQDSMDRIEAGVNEVLLRGAERGHSCLKLATLARETARLLRIDEDRIREALGELLEYGVYPVTIVDDTAYVYHLSLYEAETGVAHHIERLQTVEPLTVVGAEMILEKWAAKEEVTLAAEQIQAILAALETGVLVITGGPGTGKTTLVRALLAVVSQARLRTVLAAPTGRAAKRLAETSEQDASTLHKLLEAGLVEDASVFQRDAQNPLKGDLFIIDEASMLDVSLMYHFLEAVPDHARVIFVGDVDQLPPVGPGNVLRDIIASDTVPVVRLEHIYRQEEGSGIALAAAAIRQGQMPVWRDDVTFIDCAEEEALEEVLSLCRTLRYADPERQFAMQVLAPMYRGICGVDALNQALQRQAHGYMGKSNRGLQVGDKVMQRKNNYEKGVYNGDLGEVYAVGEEHIAVDFRIKNSTYERGELQELQLAYALTVHKSQGSEYETVVLVLLPSQQIMLQRNLVYTAVTRAKSHVYIVGSPAAFKKALRTQHTAGRTSLLRARLTGEIDA